MARAATQRRDRRGEIAHGLYRCILRRGYADTTLREIAEAAGMSPSHVGYYFDNKAAILEDYAKRICRQNLAQLPELDPSEPARSFARLAEFCFGEGRTSAGTRGVIQELTGLSVHEPKLRRIKSSHTAQWRAYLENLFEQSSTRAGLSPRDAALRAHAVLVGLNTNASFDDALDPKTAEQIFAATLRELAGLPEAPASRATVPGRPRRNPRRHRKVPQ